MMKASLVVALLLIGTTTTSVNGQSRKVLIDDDLEIKAGGDDDILSNEALKRAAFKTKAAVVPADIVKTETMELEYNFEGKVYGWSPRGQILSGKDSQGKIVNIEVHN